MTTAPSGLELTTPALPEFDLDAATEQLFRSIQRDFDRPLVLRLGQDPTIDVSRAETELRLLDLFAVYLAIKTTDCEKWKDVGSVLFERVCAMVLTWWAPAWDTQDDVIEVLKGRFAAYNRLADATGPADLDNMSILVGLTCAVTIRKEPAIFSDDVKTADGGLGKAAAGLVDHDGLLYTAAAAVFRTRFDAVSELLHTLRQ